MRKILSFFFKIIIVIASFWGVILCFTSSADSFMGGVKTMMYYTNQSNLWLGSFALVMLILQIISYFNHKILLRPWLYLFKYVLTVSITLTGVVFCFVLAPTFGSNCFSLSNVLTHIVVPLTAIADFYVEQYGYRFKTRDFLYALIPPLYYLFYAIAGYLLKWDFGHGNNYPYFFFNFGSPAGIFGFSNVMPYFMGSFYWIIALVILVVLIAIFYLKSYTLLNKKEVWDSYDVHGLKQNIDLLRGEKIPDGLFHIVCEAVVKHTDGSYLLMKRSLDKEIYPGFYELSAGGSALKGESPIGCIRRELREETGIKKIKLTQIGFQIVAIKNCLYYVFLGVTGCQKDKIRLQEGETVDYLWINKRELSDFTKSDLAIKYNIMRIQNYLDVLRIGSTVEVKIDRPIGYNHQGIIYHVNYGFIPNVVGGDGEEQDAYILGVDEKLSEFKGGVIAICLRRDDCETKWIVTKEGLSFSDKEIMESISFQEKFFDSIIVR